MTTGSPRTVPCQVKRWAATVPDASTPTGVAIGAVADRHLVEGALLPVEANEPGREHVDRLLEASAEDAEHRAPGRELGRLAEEHHLADHRLGSVAADVGELLGAHVADDA